MPKEVESESNITARVIVTGMPRGDERHDTKQITGPIVDALPPPDIEKRISAPTTPASEPKSDNFKGRTFRMGNVTLNGWNGELPPRPIDYPESGKI